MNVEYRDGRTESWRNLTEEQAAELAAERIGNPEVESVEVFREPNRRERRRAAALGKKKGKQSGKGKRR